MSDDVAPTIAPAATRDGSSRHRSPLMRFSAASASGMSLFMSSFWMQRIKKRFWLLGEIILVLLWAMLVTRPYLTMDTMLVPKGREYLTHISSYHFWTRLQLCGWCSAWDESMGGGAPALANPFTSMLHPLGAGGTLTMGVRNGSKLVLVGSFALAGLAQWWLAAVLGLGRAARLWSAAMVVVAGHLAGRMPGLGGIGLIVSAASCALVLPPLLVVSRTGSLRMAVVLGVTLAMAAVAGQGYLQIGLVLSLPVIILLLPKSTRRRRRIAGRLLLAALLAFLLAAPFLLPFLHFLSEFSKHTDIRGGQPFPFVWFNLVVNDPQFYETEIEALGKLRYAWLYSVYIGWVPLLLALWALRGGGRNLRERRALPYLATVALLTLFLASEHALKLIEVLTSPEISERLAGVRFYPLIAGMVVPPLLGLAAIGLDKLVRARKPFSLRIRSWKRPRRPLFALDTRWLLVIPLVFALQQGWSLAREWIDVEPLPPQVYPVLEALRTPDEQWVRPPWDHIYSEPGVGMGIKFAESIRPWHWENRPIPPPVLEANPFEQPEEMVEQGVVQVDEQRIPLYVAPPGREYAAVTHADGERTVCTAQGIGGDIDVQCDLPQAGTLTVRENMWSGWQATIDGQAVELQPRTDWLTMDVPAGTHTIQLRYRPWDAAVGAGLCLFGMVLALVIWVRGERRVRR